MTFPGPPARLLVLAWGHGLGDSVLSLPLLSGVRRVWPGCRVTWATTAPTADWFREAGLVHETADLSRSGLWNAWGRLRRARFDVAVDLRLDHTVGSAAFCAMMGAVRTVGFDCPFRGWWFSDRVPADYGNAHHAVNLERLAAALGVPWGDPRPPVSNAARERAAALLAEAGVPDGRSVAALVPGGRHDLARVDKRWPAERFSELGRRLLSEGVSVVVTGTEGERSLVCAACPPGGAALAGRTTPQELAALFERCALVVGNNSGPVHLAAALGIPTVSFSGGVHMTHWRPQGDLARVILRDENCRESACRTCPDKGRRCLGRIAPDRVLAETLTILKR